jgi:hypothetical protein
LSVVRCQLLLPQGSYSLHLATDNEPRTTDVF